MSLFEDLNAEIEDAQSWLTSQSASSAELHPDRIARKLAAIVYVFAEALEKRDIEIYNLKEQLRKRPEAAR